VETTTYGSTRSAHAVIGAVNRVHARIRGTTSAGDEYAATDPELLRWVHVAEVYSFLEAYRRHGAGGLSDEESDAYFAETANVATLLGATDVPTSVVAVHDYFASMQPELAVTDDTREAARFLLRPPDRDRATRIAVRVVGRASLGVLPSWA